MALPSSGQLQEGLQVVAVVGGQAAEPAAQIGGLRRLPGGEGVGVISDGHDGLMKPVGDASRDGARLKLTGDEVQRRPAGLLLQHRVRAGLGRGELHQALQAITALG